jgi:hypothetical protein
MLKCGYTTIDFNYSYRMCFPFCEGVEKQYRLLFSKADGFALPAKTLSVSGREIPANSVISVDDPFLSGILMLAMREKNDRNPRFVNMVTFFDDELEEYFLNCSSAPTIGNNTTGCLYRKTREVVISRLDSFPEGCILASGLNSKSNLSFPRVYCNYRQYQWSMDVANTLS